MRDFSITCAVRTCFDPQGSHDILVRRTRTHIFAYVGRSPSSLPEYLRELNGFFFLRSFCFWLTDINEHLLFIYCVNASPEKKTKSRPCVTRHRRRRSSL